LKDRKIKNGIQKLKAKSPFDSETIMTEIVCPNDTNPMGILQGGRLVQWMDIAAAICEQLHSGRVCVTVSINNVNFKAPAKLGDIITIRANISKAFTTSMEISVQTHATQVPGEKKYLINDACFTFVALDHSGRPVKVPAIKSASKHQIDT